VSLATLADDEILRTDRYNLNLTAVIRPRVDPVVTRLQISNADKNDLNDAVESVAAESPIQKTPGSNGLDLLVKYIPTESVTLYIAATAAISSITTIFPSVTPLRLYVGFVVLTPVIFLLTLVAKRRSQKLPAFPATVGKWPWWKLIASTAAFAVWALAVPPLVDTDAGKFVAALGALVVSTFLSLLGAAFEPPEAPPEAKPV
jgi:hypothetical protein